MVITKTKKSIYQFGKKILRTLVEKNFQKSILQYFQSSNKRTLNSNHLVHSSILFNHHLAEKWICSFFKNLNLHFLIQIQKNKKKTENQQEGTENYWTPFQHENKSKNPFMQFTKLQNTLQ